MSVIVQIEDPQDTICAELIAELSNELGGLYGDDGSAAFQPDDVSGERAAFVVAWLDDKPVGCGALRPMAESSIAEVKRMYVRQIARGQGISRKILSKLETLARAHQYRAIWLETGIYQKAAIGLYEATGYHKIPCYGAYADDPLSLCYEKLLR